MPKTIEEIAKIAGVSVTTVSLVINGKASDYRISAKTQERIKRIVGTEGFTPNQYARGFRMKKTSTIGLIVPDLTNWFFSQLCREIELIARKEHYQILIASSDDNESTEYQAISNLVNRNVDGLIIASVMKKDRITNEILSVEIPIVYIDRRIETDKVSWVTSDNFRGAFELTDLICSRGAKEPFYLGGTEKISTSKNRIKGFKEALKKNRLAFNPDNVLQDDYTIPAGYRLMKKVYEKRKEGPDSIITGSYTLLEGALRFLNEKMDGIPDELIIGTYDDHPLLDLLTKKIPSVRQNTEIMGQTAFNMLTRAIKGEEKIRHEIVEPTLIPR